MRFSEKAFIYLGLSLMVFTAVVGLFPHRVSAMNVLGSVTDAATINLTSITIDQNDLANLNKDAAQNTHGVDQINTLIKNSALGDYKNADISYAFTAVNDTTGGQALMPDGFKYDKQTGASSSCKSTIQIEGNSFKLVSLRLDLGGKSCVDMFNTKYALQLGTTENMKIWFDWKNANTMVRVDARDGDFTETDSKGYPNYYFSAHTTNNCKDNVKASSDFTNGLLRLGCTPDLGKPVPFLIGKISNRASAPNTAGGTTGSTATNPTCESNGALSWLVCPVINLLADASDGIYNNVIAPWLQTDTIQIDNNSVIFQAWSSLRVIGNIVLVIAMLVIVFGQAIGGGMVDAYTAKKVLPKILIAAIMINLSIYIVAVMVDVTNILGHGLSTLLMQLIQNGGGSTNVTLGNGAGATFGLGAIIGGGALWAGLAGGAAAMMQGFLVFILLPGFLAFLGVLITLILRQGIITALIIISPIAFALYCLPAGEKYLKQWWQVLFKALLIYPIISLVFGVAKILAITTNQAGNGQKNGLTAVGFEMASVVLLFIPIFLIPFAFKLAGGAIGQLYGTLSGFGKRSSEAIKGNVNDPNSTRNRTKRRVGEGYTKSRERGYKRIGNLQKTDFARKHHSVTRGLGLAGSAVAIGDLEAKRAAINKQEGELRELKSGYGPDDSIRALFAEKQADGRWISAVSGKEFAEQDVMKARSLYGGNGGSLSAAQAAMNYEVTKAANDQEYNQFVDHMPKMLESFGYNKDEINSATKGVGFSNAAKRLDLKHTSWEKDASGAWQRKVDRKALAQDAAENFGSYPIANMKTSPIYELDRSYDTAQGMLDGTIAYDTDETNVHGIKSADDARQVIADVQSTARTLDTRMRRGDFGGAVGEADGVPITAGASGGPGHVNDAIQRLVNKVSTSPAGPAGGGTAPRGGFPGPRVS